jgi:hypothetical protein
MRWRFGFRPMGIGRLMRGMVLGGSCWRNSLAANGNGAKGASY